ncbi:recombinase family protein [candidate division KSB1 bacterium]|nr:recombinase family protein [candidate division KSB1 bacterium]
MQKGIIYVRVSSDEQIKGMSLDFQKQDCLKYAKEKEIEIVEIYEERGESAKFANRPKLIEAMELCRKRKNSINAFIIWKLDRLSRNQLDYYYIKRTLLDSGVKLHSATEPTVEDNDSIAGKVFETFSALQAEIDNTIRSERTRRGFDAKLAQGIWPWPSPLGYKPLGSKKRGEKKNQPDPIDPAVFPILQKCLKAYATGQYSRIELQKMLDDHSLARIRKQKTHKQLVYRILYKYLPFYAGYLIHPRTGEQIKGVHQAMLTPEEYEDIVCIRDCGSVASRRKREADNPEFPLRRTVKCADCGQLLTASKPRGNGGCYAYYHCSTRGCASYGKSISKSTLEEEFSRFAAQYQLDDKYVEDFLAMLQGEFSFNRSEQERQRRRSERALQELRIKRQNVFEMRENGSYTQEEFMERKEAVLKAIAEEERLLATLQQDQSDWAKKLDRLGMALADFSIPWREMDHEQKQRFQKSLLPAGILYHRKNGFGTAEISPIFAKKWMIADEKSLNMPHRGLIWNRVVSELDRQLSLMDAD